MEKLLAFALPKFTLLSLFIKKPILIVVSVPAIAAVSQVVSYEGVWFIFWWFFAGDLLSGLLASYYEWKKSDHKERWFFGKGEGFSSDKAKKMGIKLAVYLLVPQLLINLQKTLLLKNFKYSTISDAEFELATIVVLFFCAIEGFSIFHENLPKCGFDLWKSIKKMIGFYKEAKKEITE
ncbi:phage holin family protein [Flavobacterium sp. ZT3R17]|uniref:phage holin family protein n=1 Tax=Flavobacterium cryoconiti TaxID=3398736 RepID=UPI003A898153